MEARTMKSNFPDAKQDIKGLIDAHHPYPRHQGVTDITEFVEFARIANGHNLTDSQYDKLIDWAKKYHDSK